MAQKILMPEASKLLPAAIRVSRARSALLEGLDLMRLSGADRVSLMLSHSSVADKIFTGRPISGNDAWYYGSNLLSQQELEFIQRQQSYTAVSLVLRNVFNSITYPGEGLEVADRSFRTRFFLHGISEEPGELSWATRRGVHTEDRLNEAITAFKLQDFTPEQILTAVKSGIEEIVSRLMHSQ